MKPRLMVLLVLLSCVAGATAWRVANPRERQSVSMTSLDMRSPPEFELLDQNSRMTRLKGYLGRYRVLVYFFEASRGLDADPVLRRLREVYPALKKSGIRIFAISSPLGPDHKPQSVSWPFPILRDTTAGQPDSCSARWGRTTIAEGVTGPAQVQPAAFLIGATGLVRWANDFPEPAQDAMELVNALASGRI